MTDLGIAYAVAPPDETAPVVDQVVLTYAARFLRRKVLQTAGGCRLLVDLAQATSVATDDCLVLENGTRVAVVAAPEPLLAISGPDLIRLAWHIGNRH